MQTTGHNVSRRTFVGAVFAGLGITGAYARPPKPKSGATPMREFGKTGVKLTVIGQGGARLALMRTKEAARAHVRYAYDLGLNYFDCAHGYWDGHSEEVYGDVLAGVRKNVFITTKSTERTRKGAEDDLHSSLRSLKTDYVDLWQVHGIQDQSDVNRVFSPGGAIEAFEAAKKAGKCRYFGFTGHHDPQAHLAMLKAYDKWDSVLMPVHAADHAYLSFEKTALPVAVEKGIAIQAIKVFCKAFLLRALSPRECLTYTLSMGVHVAVCGAGTQGQMEDNIRTAQSFRRLTAEQLADVRSRAIVGQGVYTGPAMEYWKKATP